MKKINVLKEVAFSFRAREKRRADVRQFDRITLALAVVILAAMILAWRSPFTLGAGKTAGFAYFFLVLFAYLPMEIVAAVLRACGAAYPAWFASHPAALLGIIDLAELALGWVWVHTRSVRRNGGDIVRTATHIGLILLVWGCCHLAGAALCRAHGHHSWEIFQQGSVPHMGR